MKNLFLTLGIIFFLTPLHAQVGTDLEFSQTITKCATMGAGNATVGTVPPGKIWKLVGVSAPRNSASSSCDLLLYFTSLGGNHIKITDQDGAGNTCYAQLPIFFNENETIEINYSCTGTTSAYNICISIIEYTVVP